MIDKLVKEISRYSRIYNFTLSTAESCTGGYISHKITDIEGSSDYFLGGYITYSRDSKIRDLKINSEYLERYGIYSTETAKAMAEAIRKIFNTDFGLSTTGIAPPRDNKSTEKAGKIFIGISSKEGTISKELHIKATTRSDFKERATKAALILLKKEIEKQKV